MPPRLNIQELNRIYQEAEEADRETFAEFRTNVLLIAGEHYNRKGAQRALNRTRASNNLTEAQKLRITKNHTQRVVKHYVSVINDCSPGVSVYPRHDTDMQDQKTAELAKSVWEDGKDTCHIPEKKMEWLRDFVGVGEVCLKLYRNPNAGRLIGFRQASHPETGEPMLDEMGQPQADENQPVFSGQIEFEKVFASNLLRQVGARSMKETRCWIIRKMCPTDDLKRMYAGQPEKLKLFTESKPEDYVVFDADKTAYEKLHNQTLVREYYWPVSADYPYGYFAYTTEAGIFEEGPLPGGIWPLAWAGFDEHTTKVRAQSIVKVVRPYQCEINRLASAKAMTSITVGDDKILYQSGTKLQQGALLPGVRGVTYQGAEPTVLPGREGAQYDKPLQDTITELYFVVNMPEENQNKDLGQIDPWNLLYRSARQQKKFNEPAEKFERFLIDVAQIYLELQKFYLDDDAVIMAVGKKEQINISEFKNSNPLFYRIKLEPQDETLETKFGRQLSLNHILQYVGPNLGKDEIGRLIKHMPFANTKELTGDLTLDYDIVQNDMLAMERGQFPAFRQSDKHEYAVKRLDLRMSQPDFVFLPGQVQKMYQIRKQMHEQAEAQRLEKLMAMKNEFIPVGGAMIATDMYVPNPKGPDAPAKRVRIPYQALDWLVKKMETQGMGLEKLENQNAQTLSEVAGMLMQTRAGSPTPSPSSPSPGPAFMNGPRQALGVS